MRSGSRGILAVLLSDRERRNESSPQTRPGFQRILSWKFGLACRFREDYRHCRSSNFRVVNLDGGAGVEKILCQSVVTALVDHVLRKESWDRSERRTDLLDSGNRPCRTATSARCSLDYTQVPLTAVLDTAESLAHLLLQQAAARPRIGRRNPSY